MWKYWEISGKTTFPEKKKFAKLTTRNVWALLIKKNDNLFCPDLDF
jgi:hypothetical protein